MTIAIVTDSTSDIEPGKAAEMGVTVVPLNVRFGDRDFLDRVDLDSSGFFKMLSELDARPSTSLPSPGAFVEVYKKILQNNDEIISIHISSHLSGTFQSARTAAMSLGGKNIHVIDSGQVASGLMILVERAAHAVADGVDASKIIMDVTESAKKTQSYFIVDTLEYLERGGRIGKASSLIGGVLNIKPILTLKDGVIEPVSKVRSRRKGIGKVADMIAEEGSPEVVAISHAACPDAADAAELIVGERFAGARIIRSEIGPVIGTHTGPGAVEISCL